MKRVFITLGVLAAIAVAAMAAWWWLQGAGGTGAGPAPVIDGVRKILGIAAPAGAPEVVASGFVEAVEVVVGAEVGGRVTDLAADEGDEVVQGEALVWLDDSLLLVQIQAAQADLEIAEATLAQVMAGVRPEGLRLAQAVVAQAEAAHRAAVRAWEDAQAMVATPQQLDLAITQARSLLGVLDLRERQAQALADSAQAARDLAERTSALLENWEPYQEWAFVGVFDLNDLPDDIPLPPNLQDGEYIIGSYKIVLQGNLVSVYVLVTVDVPADVMEAARRERALATYGSWEAWTRFDEAQHTRGGIASQLSQLEAQRDNPVALRLEADAAWAQVQVAAAAAGLARAQLEALEIGATSAQIATAEAQVQVAKAALHGLREKQEQWVIHAPISGMVLERTVRVGELAVPAAPLIRLANLDELWLTIYIAEDQLGRVSPGMEVSVTVDAYPGRVFRGVVRSIATQAEFTPKNVQSEEERMSMVFAVTLALDNVDHALKPGMPADATLRD